MEAWPQLLILLLHGGMAANFQSSRNLTKTSQNFQSYTLPNFLRKLLKSSVENFSKLPILHSSNPLAILRKLLTKTSNSSTFGYENLKLPILSQTSDSSNLKTWKTLQLPILPFLDFSLMKSWFSATFPQNVCFEQNLVVFPKFAPIFFFFFDKMDFSSKV